MRLKGFMFGREAVWLLLPGLVFMTPLVLSSVTLDWNVLTRDQRGFSYVIYWSGVLWLLMCFIAAMLRPSSSSVCDEDKAGEGTGVGGRVVALFSLSLFWLSLLCAWQIHQYDRSAKRTIYDHAHSKFCELNLNDSVQRLAVLLESLDANKPHKPSSSESEHMFTAAFQGVAGAANTNPWATAIVLSTEHGLYLFNANSRFMPVAISTLANQTGFDVLGESIEGDGCRLLQHDGRYRSLRTFRYHGSSSVAILAEVEAKNR